MAIYFSMIPIHIDRIFITALRDVGPVFHFPRADESFALMLIHFTTDLFRVGSTKTIFISFFFQALNAGFCLHKYI